MRKWNINIILLELVKKIDPYLTFNILGSKYFGRKEEKGKYQRRLPVVRESYEGCRAFNHFWMVQGNILYHFHYKMNIRGVINP